jgi:hypothetical protein
MAAPVLKMVHWLSGLLRGFAVAAGAAALVVAAACGGPADPALSADVTAGPAPFRPLSATRSRAT